MEIRLFDPAVDSRDTLVALWNEHYGTTLFTPAQFARMNPENVILIEDGKEMVGFAMLLDGGLPYAVLDQVYLQPRYRRFTTIRDVYRFAEEVCRERGIRWFYGLMDEAGAESETMIDLLRRRAAWSAQYLGERPLFVRAISREG